MDLDGQLTKEQFQSSQVGCISNDFDVNEFELEEVPRDMQKWLYVEVKCTRKTE